MMRGQARERCLLWTGLISLLGEEIHSCCTVILRRAKHQCMDDKDLMNPMNTCENRINPLHGTMPSATSKFRMLRYLGE